VTLFLIFLVLIDRGLYAFFNKTFSSFETVGFSEMLQKEPDIAILGSSRACHHFDAEHLQNLTNSIVFNAGRDGLGIPYMRGVCDVLLKECPPKIMIIEVGPRSIIDKYCSRHLTRISLLAPYMDDSEVIRRMLYKKGPYEKIKYLSKSYRYNGLPMYIFYEWLKKDEVFNGYEPLKKKMKQRDITKIVEQDKLQINSECVGYLKEMIQSARQKGVHVILITSPQWGGLERCDEQIIESFDFLKELSEEEQVPYYIMTDLNKYPQFKDASLFAHPVHLNEEGAKIFSGLVAEILFEEGYLEKE
jgi:hypothetical protein